MGELFPGTVSGIDRVDRIAVDHEHGLWAHLTSVSGMLPSRVIVCLPFQTVILLATGTGVQAFFVNTEVLISARLRPIRLTYVINIRLGLLR